MNNAKNRSSILLPDLFAGRELTIPSSHVGIRPRVRSEAAIRLRAGVEHNSRYEMSTPPFRDNVPLHFLEKLVSLVPHSDIHPPQEVEFLCGLEVNPNCQTSAVCAPAHRRRAAMNTASVFIQVYALSIRLVGDHKCARDVRVRLGPVIHCHVFCFKPDGVARATQSAAVAWDVTGCKLLLHVSLSEGLSATRDS